MTRPVFRHLFPAIDPCAPSRVFHPLSISSLNATLFDRKCLRKLNCHGQGFEVEELEVKHRIYKVSTGFMLDDGKFIQQPSLFSEELSMKITKKIVTVKSVSLVNFFLSS